MKKLGIVTGIITMAISLLSVTTAPVAFAGPTGGNCNPHFLTFPTWYRGLTKGDCSIKSPSDVGGISPFIWKIVLNIVEIMLQLVGYASVGFIMYGGFLYLTSAGQPDKATAGRKTILNAIIGLVLSFFSVAIVTLISGNIT